MEKKIKVAVLFGGKSAEHEVSLQSAKNVIAALDLKKYELILIGIDKSGRWHLNEDSQFLLNETNPRLIKLRKGEINVTMIPGEDSSHTILNVRKRQVIGSVDVVFPVLHGPYGEDGTIQGMLKLMDVPFVGASVLGSSVGMDKDVTKRLLRDAGIPIGRFRAMSGELARNIGYQELIAELGEPFFVKPANLGSSVGVHKIHAEAEYKTALVDTLKYDRKVLVEEFIHGREIECSVLGNDHPTASVPGEIVPHDEFYSYKAKYVDENGATLIIPAKLSPETDELVRETACRVFTTLCCEGMARVDFFLKESGELFVNEINTIPGFTGISMYPKLWEESGVPQSELVDRLIELSLKRHEQERSLKSFYETHEETS